MTMIDPERERRRLEEFYAGQFDGELQKIAKQAYELTDIAQEVLMAELARRGLEAKFAGQAPIVVKPAPKKPEPEPGDPPPPEPPDPEIDSSDGELERRDMVVIRQFRDLPEALLAKGSLDSAGIDCKLADDNIVRMDWFWSNLMGGVKLLVDFDNADAANEILEQPIPESFEAVGTGEYQQPRCPQCGSLDVNYQEVDPAAYVTAWVINLPIPLHRRAWRCRVCTVEWEEDGLPDPNSTESPA